MSIQNQMEEVGRRARAASRRLARLSAAQKNDALHRVADALVAEEAKILEANEADLVDGRAAGLSAAMLDRLALSTSRIASMAAGVREVAALPDPVGEVTHMARRPNGLLVGRVRIPLGVILLIYESRPNVTA